MGFKVRNGQELLQYLIKGFYITCSNGKRYITFEQGELRYFCNNENYRIDIDIDTLLSLYKDGWKILPLKNKWWHNIPNSGIWCWVSNLTWDDKTILERVYSCMEVSDYYSFKTSRNSFKYAVPIKKSDLELFNDSVEFSKNI
ncbi:MAG: hypothetical protein PHC28_15585 [Flavobacterium sp.]|uniref:hypothetical protein n=1 Tax=Flavobacterium sp. TaxID=239 RepID=UPI00260AA67A|nr:hypothetical protein [Flavobacterium sp.]MDD5151875.1 hypothetical protein [Flavobacterium sp.]